MSGRPADMSIMLLTTSIALCSACGKIAATSDAAVDAAADAALDAAACVEPPPGIVAWWAGDNLDPAVAVDVSGQHHDGALAGGVTYVDGEIRSAFSFNGSGGFGETFTVLPFASAISIEFWVYPLPHHGSGLITTVDNSIPGSGWLVGYYGDNQGQGNPSQYAAFGMVEPSPPSTVISSPDGSVPFGRWTHIAATSDGSTMRLYINGTELVALSPSPPVARSTFKTLLGAYQRNGVKEQFLNGRLDEVAVYDHVLSAEQVQRIFAAGSNGKCRP